MGAPRAPAAIWSADAWPLRAPSRRVAALLSARSSRSAAGRGSGRRARLSATRRRLRDPGRRRIACASAGRRGFRARNGSGVAAARRQWRLSVGGGHRAARRAPRIAVSAQRCRRARYPRRQRMARSRRSAFPLSSQAARLRSARARRRGTSGARRPRRARRPARPPARHARRRGGATAGGRRPSRCRDHERNGRSRAAQSTARREVHRHLLARLAEHAYRRRDPRHRRQRGRRREGEADVARERPAGRQRQREVALAQPRAGDVDQLRMREALRRIAIMVLAKRQDQRLRRVVALARPSGRASPANAPSRSSGR